MSDDRLSIAELQRLHEIVLAGDRPSHINNAASAVLSTAIPVLLEIAKAARAFRDARCSGDACAAERSFVEQPHSDTCPVDVALERLRAAAGKVTP